MHWYLVHTKPRQEECALENLHWQGYQCYLPTIPSEKLRQGLLTVADKPLFPRYLFIRLGMGDTAKSWAPIELLRTQEASVQTEPERLFKPGERVRLTEVPFAGIEGIYQMADGERRVMVLIEILSKPVAVRVAPASLRKAS